MWHTVCMQKQSWTLFACQEWLQSINYNVQAQFLLVTISKAMASPKKVSRMMALAWVRQPIEGRDLGVISQDSVGCTHVIIGQIWQCPVASMTSPSLVLIIGKAAARCTVHQVSKIVWLILLHSIITLQKLLGILNCPKFDTLIVLSGALPDFPWNLRGPSQQSQPFIEVSARAATSLSALFLTSYSWAWNDHEQLQQRTLRTMR